MVEDTLLCIQVAIYDDWLEVTSPGGLYNGLTYEEVMNGHSKIRNKGIANIFSQMGLVEASENPQLSAVKLAEKIGVASRNIENNIKMLKEYGILIRHGSPKNGYWEVVGE